MYIPHVINKDSVSVFMQNQPPVSVASDHPNFKALKIALLKGDFSSVPNLLTAKKAVQHLSQGLVQINGDSVTYDGREIPSYMSSKLLSMIREGILNIEPFKNFIKNLMANPSFRAREELSKFMDYKELPFDENGMVIAYKGVGAYKSVGNDFYSVHGNLSTRVLKGQVDGAGRIYNGIGEEIVVDRADVDDDCNRTCSNGLHAGSYDYASGWGNQVVLIKFNPADVVSVPSDCNGQKVRVCAYKVIGECKGEIIAPIVESNKDAYEQKTFTVEDAVNDLIVNEFSVIDEPEIVEDYLYCSGYSKEVVNEAMADFYIAVKIENFLERVVGDDDGDTVSLKRIQSALKIKGLTQDKIEYLIEKFVV